MRKDRVFPFFYFLKVYKFHQYNIAKIVDISTILCYTIIGIVDASTFVLKNLKKKYWSGYEEDKDSCGFVV